LNEASSLVWRYQRIFFCCAARPRMGYNRRT
jgi:hypothetical protein